MASKERGAFFYELALAMTVIIPSFTGLVSVSLMLNHSLDMVEMTRLLDRSVRHAIADSVPGQRCAAIAAAVHTSLSTAGLGTNELAVDDLEMDSLRGPGELLSLRLQNSQGSIPLIQQSLQIPTLPVLIVISSDVAAELSDCTL